MSSFRPLKNFKRKYLSIPYFLFLMFFVVLPLLIIVFYALTIEENGVIKFSFDNFINFFSNGKKLGLLAISMIIGALNTILCLIIGYPIAYILSNKKLNRNIVTVVLFIAPMWVNFVLRTAATRNLLVFIGIEGGYHPYLATMIGMVYNYLPFTILPLYSTMLKMDRSQIEASYDLGANKFQTFIKTIIPMTLPGIVSAATMVFMPTMSSYVISDVMGERKIQLIGNTIQFNFDQMRWHDGSFVAFVMLLIIGIFTLLTKNIKNDENARGSLW